MSLKLCPQCKSPFMESEETCPRCPATYVWKQKSRANSGCLILAILLLVMLVSFTLFFFIEYYSKRF